MNINRILCPCDLSNSNELANDVASMLAEASGASIIYLHVAQVGVTGETHDYAMQRLAQKKMRRLIDIQPTREAIQFSHDVQFGITTSRIVEYAYDNQVDLIVLSTVSHSGLKRVLLGSVAQAVVREAQCPVLTIKPNGKMLDNVRESESFGNSETIPSSANFSGTKS